MSELRSIFGSDLIVHDYLDAVHGRYATELSDIDIVPFDPSDLTSVEEATALSMLDRNDSYSQTMDYGQRVEFLLLMLGYWSLVFERTQATAVIFEEVPHQAIDYALYLAAGHHGLLTVVPIRGLPDAGFLANDKVGGKPRGILEQQKASADGVRAGTGAEAFIAGMDADYDTHLNMILWDHKDSVREIVSKSSRIRQSLTLARTLRPRHGLKQYWTNLRHFKNDQKTARRTLQNSRMTYPEFLWHKSRTLIKKARLRRLYQRLTSQAPDLTQPFIYCCLQYQPEASTSPMAGRYVDQWLMVAHLAAVLPDGWHIYVKEHPSQFSGEYSRYGERFRSEAFYKKLLSYENVSLVPLHIDSFTLIDASRAVAGPGGSVCFEAVARGKAAINFGEGFFVGCPGIHQVKKAEEVAVAVNHIASEGAPSKSEVIEHARLLDRHTYPGAIGGPGQLDRMDISLEKNARLHKQCWLETASWERETN
ncbi:MAG: hypothetical protein ACE37E_10450 [Hyphomicrobiales bacterium]